jgi:hypothetical protein
MKWQQKQATDARALMALVLIPMLCDSCPHCIMLVEQAL